MTTADNLAALVRREPLLRKSVSRYVLTAPNTSQARLHWQEVLELVSNPNVTRFEVEVAALDCGLTLHAQRALNLERRVAE